MSYSVTLIPGDGVGPEITDATLAVLDATGIEFAWDRQTAGATSIERRGEPLPHPALESIRMTRVALKGPLETPIGGGYRSVNVSLRKEFGLYANLRPVRSIVPFRSYADLDLVMVRENTQGLYAGVEHFVQIGDDPHAVAESVVTHGRCTRPPWWGLPSLFVLAPRQSSIWGAYTMRRRSSARSMKPACALSLGRR